jgi:NACalpha-BTF3-like transcription factor
MGYEDLEINRQYHRLYYQELKTKNPEAYKERKEKARLRYHKNKPQLQSDKPKRQYTKRNLKQPKKKDEDTDSIKTNDIELVSSDE